MSRIFQPYDLRLRVLRNHLFGCFGRYVTVFSAEYEKLRDLRRAQHFVLVPAGYHAAQQGYDSLVFGDENLLGKVFDFVPHACAVLFGESCGGSYPRQHLFLPGLDERDLPAAVLGLLRRVGIGRGAEQHHAVEHFGVAFAESQRYVSAHRMSYERAASDAEGFERVGDRVGQKIHCMDRARHHRNAVARQIECHHAHLLI